MDRDRVDHFRSRLVEMRARLIPTVNDIEEAITESNYPPGELSSAPTHLGNIATGEFDRNITLAQNEEGILEQVEASLERMEQGTYGICQECAQAITQERLEAVPYTAYCIRCAERQYAG